METPETQEFILRIAAMYASNGPREHARYLTRFPLPSCLAVAVLFLNRRRQAFFSVSSYFSRVLMGSVT